VVPTPLGSTARQSRHLSWLWPWGPGRDGCADARRGRGRGGPGYDGARRRGLAGLREAPAGPCGSRV